MSNARSNIDPITLEILHNGLKSVTDETYITITKAAYSTNIKERRDHSTAIMDVAGRLIVYSVSGTFQSENLEVSAANLATIAADAVPHTLTVAGRFMSTIILAHFVLVLVLDFAAFLSDKGNLSAAAVRTEKTRRANK